MGKEPMQIKNRLLWLDGLRGLTVISMVCYHGMWDLVYLYGLNAPWYHTQAAYLWQQSICWTFILLSGFCWQFNRKPVRRGLIVFGGGLLVTAVTLLAAPESRVIFGVLTLLGSCMLLLAVLHPLLRRVPGWLGIGVSGVLFVLFRDVNRGWLGFEGLHLLRLPEWLYRSMLSTYMGFPSGNFFSTDYFSLLPWFFLFATGYFIHTVWCDRGRKGLGVGPELPMLSLVGRNALWVYLLHQPVLSLVFFLIYGS